MLKSNICLKYFFLYSIILLSFTVSAQKDSIQSPESRYFISFTAGTELPFGTFGANSTTSTNINDAGYATEGYAVEVPFWITLKKNKNIGITGIARYDYNPYDISHYFKNLIATPPYNTSANQLETVLQSSFNHPGYSLFTFLAGPNFKKSYTSLDVTFRIAVGLMACRTPASSISFTFIASQYNSGGPNPGTTIDTITSVQNTNSVMTYSFAADLGIGLNWHLSPNMFLTLNIDHLNAQFAFKTTTNEVGTYTNNPAISSPQTTDNHNILSVSLWNAVIGVGFAL